MKLRFWLKEVDDNEFMRAVDWVTNFPVGEMDEEPGRDDQGTFMEVELEKEEKGEAVEYMANEGFRFVEDWKFEE